MEELGVVFYFGKLQRIEVDFLYWERCSWVREFVKGTGAGFRPWRYKVELGLYFWIYYFVGFDSAKQDGEMVVVGRSV